MASAGGGADYFINTVYRVGNRVRPFNMGLDGSDNIVVSGVYNYNGTGTYSGGFVYKLNNETADMDWMKYQDYGNANGTTFTYGCDADNSGNVYTTGYHGANTYTYLKGCVSKYNSSGALQWVRDYGDESSNNFYIPSHVSVNGSNIVASGYRRYSGLGYYEGLNLGYNSSGTKQFDQRVRINDLNWYSTGSVFNSSNNMLAMTYGTNSYAQGTVEVREQTFASSPSPQDTIRFWCPYSGQNLKQELSSGRLIAADSNDDVIMGAELYVSGSDRSAIVAKYDVSANSMPWHKSLKIDPNGSSPSTKMSSTKSVATDSSNNVYVLIYNSNNQPKRISYILIKYNSSGTLQWAREIWNDNSSTYGFLQEQASMLIDSQDRIVIMLQSYSFVVSSNAYISTVFRLPNDGSLTGSYDCVRPFEYNSVSSSNITTNTSIIGATTSSVLSYGGIGFSPYSPSVSSPDASGVSSTTTVI